MVKMSKIMTINQKNVTVIDMGKIDGVIQSSGDILKVSDSQETSLKFGVFLNLHAHTF